MGIPGLLSWLHRRYSGMVVDCVEEKPVLKDGEVKFADSSLRNPNGVEFDYLYLDMNSIIHPCMRPDEQAPPDTQEQVLQAVCQYIDRLFRIVRPRKLLYMAVDGVAPRTLVNHQRARRYLAVKNMKKHDEQVARVRAALLARGASLPPEKAQFDAGCVAPGTAFMDLLTDCLHHYIHDRMNNSLGWKGVQVIFSDAYVPGKCDQKIFDFIRKQRAEPEFDPNTRHVICGGDAELILMALSTHEPNFYIIREDFRNKYNDESKFCHICGRQGHEMKTCPGTSDAADVEVDPTTLVNPDRFVFLRLSVLREHLERELKIPRHLFPEYEFERALDDWILLCCFVGNDVLPRLPSLVVREGAITKLVKFYKSCVAKTKGWLSDSGEIDLSRLQLIIQDLGREELKIFQTRRTNTLSFQEWQKKLKETRHADSCDDDEEEETEVEEHDQVRLWEDGFKGRYYETKFGVASNNVDFRRRVASEYVRGLCWVLRYYYQGCASWKWYFPYHYAPCASDFVNISGLSTKFEKGTQPMEPLQQLMHVLPPSSRSLVPASWAPLMSEPLSPIHDFFPVDFKIDMNGSKMAYYGGVSILVPFVDEDRLIRALKPYYKHLTEAERQRNIRDRARLYVSGHKSSEYIWELYEDAGYELQSVIDKEQRYPYRCDGVRGEVMLRADNVGIGGELRPPLAGLPPVLDNSCQCVSFLDPHYSEDFVFRARRLKDALEPPRVLKPDTGVDENRNYRPHSSAEFQRGGFGSANRGQSNYGYNTQRQSNLGYNNQRQRNQRYNDERNNTEGNRSSFGRSGYQSSYNRSGNSEQNQ